MSDTLRIGIAGAGLAGSEAAWQLAKRGLKVTLFEMRPGVMTPAHRTGGFAELVCGNSFKSRDISNAHGLLKAEMELAGSLIIEAAKKYSLPAGSALAVDRDLFSQYIENRLRDNPNIEVKNEEASDILSLKHDFNYLIIAAGPLMSPALTASLQKIIGEGELYFYDAISPVVYYDSINMDIAYRASRYDKGGKDYINCPLNKKEYEEFVDELLKSEKVPLKKFEQVKYFEGCLPIETMAERNKKTLSYGPLKPVGLKDPRTGEQPWAALQLRQENQSATLYNLVGCQTRLTWPEQKRIFRKIPGLENCRFARLGSMHRNTYINAPRHLTSELELRRCPGVFAAGQITGAEGYAESTAMGLWTAINLAAKIHDSPALQPDSKTMIGGLVNYLICASPKNFQPMNANFGLLTPYPTNQKLSKKQKRQFMAELALERWKKGLEQIGCDPTQENEFKKRLFRELKK